MIDVNLELLCNLPAPPFHARLADLAADHNFGSQREVRDRLDAMRVRYSVAQCEDGYGVVVDDFDWVCMRPRLLEYWMREYGE